MATGIMATDIDDLEAIRILVQTLEPFDLDSRERIIRWASEKLGMITPFSYEIYGKNKSNKIFDVPGDFSKDRTMSPKEFLLEKQPKTDVERIACLAYYLTHFMGVKHFKTLEISKLNTEAAQIKFSNPSFATQNALQAGYLASSTKGQKQLSASGELFVQALPDREAAMLAMKNSRPRRISRKKKSFKNFEKRKEGK